MAVRTCAFVFLILAIFVVMNTASAETCSDTFNPQTKSLAESPAFPQDPVTLRRVEAEVKNSKVAADFFMSQLRAESDAIKAVSRGKVIELDFLCLGAGPQCAGASLVLGRSSVSAMVLEKSDLVAKNFAEKEFFINSVEMDALTMHNFPGGVGTLAQHSSQKYAFSSQLAAHIQAQQYASNVPVLLGTTLVSAKIIKVGNDTIIEVKTDQGITIRTRNFLMGTGLGDTGTKIRDESYQRSFNNALSLHLKTPDQLFPIMSTDTFLVALTNAKTNGKTVRLPKELIIVGDGDGSRIAIEGISKLKLPEGFKITWIGNDFATAEQYLASRSGGDRYVHQIVPFYERGQISGRPGHVQTYEVLPGGQMRLTAAHKETGALSSAEGQMIIDATGYNNTVTGILANMGAQTKLVDVMGPLPELQLASTILARQAVDADGKLIPAYAIGAAAGPMGTREELATSPNKNPISIFNTVPRTSVLIARMLEIPALESARGKRVGRETVVPASKLISDAKVRRARQINRPVTKVQSPTSTSANSAKAS